MKYSLIIWIVLFSASSACRNSSGFDRTGTVSTGKDTLEIWHSFDIKKKDPPVNEYIPLNRMLDSLGIAAGELSILVDKSDYLLSVLHDTVIIKQYPVVFGRNPVDDKTYEGDGCTPEGTFKVMLKYEHEMWSRFIWFDYPNEKSVQKHQEAKEAGLVPADRGPGGQVGIHGVPPENDYLIRYRVNWTAGCISLTNEDVEELYPFVYNGMVVRIKK